MTETGIYQRNLLSQSLAVLFFLFFCGISPWDLSGHKGVAGFTQYHLKTNLILFDLVNKEINY